MPPKKVQAKKKTGSSKGLKVSIDDEILKDAKKQQEVLPGIPRTLHRAESVCGNAFHLHCFDKVFVPSELEGKVC
jgi:hypothetical protein